MTTLDAPTYQEQPPTEDDAPMPRQRNKRSRRMMDGLDELPTLVGEGSRVVGNLAGGGRLVVYGEVQGDSDFDGSVILAEDGRWSGTLCAVDIVIAGAVDGDVVARARLELTATARVSGGLTSGRMAIAEGAVVEGSLNITGEAGLLRFQEKRSRFSRLLRSLLRR
jgi:cytoskeletal protein CcmA (bactofilin family)